jgi:hypothetical protein
LLPVAVLIRFQSKPPAKGCVDYRPPGAAPPGVAACTRPGVVISPRSPVLGYSRYGSGCRALPADTARSLEGIRERKRAERRENAGFETGFARFRAVVVVFGGGLATSHLDAAQTFPGCSGGKPRARHPGVSDCAGCPERRSAGAAWLSGSLALRPKGGGHRFWPRGGLSSSCGPIGSRQ